MINPTNRQLQQARKVGNFIADGWRYVLPGAWYRMRVPRIMSSLTDAELEEAHRRAAYLNRMEQCRPGEEWIRVADFRFPWRARHRHSGYFFPLNHVLRHFCRDYRFSYVFGDLTEEPSVPSFVKCRPVSGGHSNAVVMKLNAVRHFRFINDPVPWESKSPRIVSRNYVYWPKRVRLLERWFGHQACDLGQINAVPDHGHPEWLVPRMSLAEQLKFKFISCIEGNDVATNLKWVMSSNSLAVMPVPEYETWFMEGALRPGEHYVEVKPDYSDLLERMEYYLERPTLAREILDNAHEYVDRFRNPRMELAVSLLVAEKYFRLSGQMVNFL